MRLLRRILLVLFLLVPLTTLFHKNEVGRWDLQHSAMAGPDEFSYLLMADHFLQGGGLSLQNWLGRDTFYPPGYPLMLAAWCKLFGGSVTAFKAHALNAVLLCIDTLVAYLFAQRLLGVLGRRGHRRFHYGSETQGWIALLVAGIFATNWHVLETSLFIMSEPAFMLAVFAWLAFALTWKRWFLHPGQTLAVATLAIAAWSIRGAGIVCVATTLLYPAGSLLWNYFKRKPSVQMGRRLLSIVAIVVMVAGYQGMLKFLSPEKALASGQQSANSYTDQLTTGLTDGHRLTIANRGDWLKLANNLCNLILDHCGDFASSFVPWPRETPDFHFRVYSGKSFALFGILGWLWNVLRKKSRLRFLDLFLLLYVALYLVWPFDFARFWSPILALMLVYGADGVIRSGESLAKIGRLPAAAAALVLLSLLLFLNSVEDLVQLGNYARRLNYVSDSLASGVSTIIQLSPDPPSTYVAAMDGDEHFALAWYFTQAAGPHGEPGGGRRYIPYSPMPHSAAKAGAPETVEEMLLRMMATAGPGSAVTNTAGDGHIFLFSYFTHRDAEGVFSNLQRTQPAIMSSWSVQKVRQQEIIVAIWELRRKPVAASKP